ncbi:glycosyltransferase family 39 protein, partial [Planctomycetota bacterium]
MTASQVPCENQWQPGPADWRIPVALGALTVFIHLPGLFNYGYFRDELYFLDCARHLDWGYVDCAPLAAVYAKIALLLGGSLPALRVLPAFAGAGLTSLTALIARELGGGRFAQILAGLSVLGAPIFLAQQSVMTMNAFEPLFWMGCAYFLIRIARRGDSRLWIGFGVLAGLGLMNKHSTLFFGLATALALLFTRLRREYVKPWIWIGAGIAMLIFLPNLIWQIQHDFPTLEGLRNVRATGKNVEHGILEFILLQVLLLHPAFLAVWGAGLFSLMGGAGKRARVLGWIFLVLLALMIAFGAKAYYPAPVYPMLFAAGALTVEGWFSRWKFTAGTLWPKAAAAA